MAVWIAYTFCERPMKIHAMFAGTNHTKLSACEYWVLKPLATKPPLP